MDTGANLLTESNNGRADKSVREYEVFDAYQNINIDIESQGDKGVEGDKTSE